MHTSTRQKAAARKVASMLCIATTLGCLNTSAWAEILYAGTESPGRDVDRIQSSGVVSVFASLPVGSSYAQGVVFDAAGNLYTANSNTNDISLITPSGQVSRFKRLASGSSPSGLAMDAGGNLYVANNSLREINRITPDGALTHFATVPEGEGSAGLAFDSSGDLYSASTETSRVHRITPAGIVSLFASLPEGSCPLGLAFDIEGNLYAAGFCVDQISKITPDGSVSLFAALPRNAQPIGIAFDLSGNLYAGGVDQMVRKVSSAGAVSPFASGKNPFTYLAVTTDAGVPLKLPIGADSLPRTKFHRGDADDNGSLQLTDAVRILGHLFLGQAAPGCLDAADADDNGVIQLTDAVRILGFLFQGQLAPAPPGPPTVPCGTDPGPEEVGPGCASYQSCGA